MGFNSSMDFRFHPKAQVKWIHLHFHFRLTFWTCEASCCDWRMNCRYSTAARLETEKYASRYLPRQLHSTFLPHTHPGPLPYWMPAAVHGSIFSFLLYLSYLKGIPEAMAKTLSLWIPLWWQWAIFWSLACRDSAGEVGIKALFIRCARSQRDGNVRPLEDGWINK